jgi:hypothetical protein
MLACRRAADKRPLGAFPCGHLPISCLACVLDLPPQQNASPRTWALPASINHCVRKYDAAGNCWSREYVDHDDGTAVGPVNAAPEPYLSPHFMCYLLCKQPQMNLDQIAIRLEFSGAYGP